MSVKVGINGFGRIGRITFRALSTRPDEFDVVAINDLGDVEANANLLRYDTVHGRYPGPVEVVDGDIEAMIRRVFDSLKAICEASGGSMADIVKLTIYLTDLANFPTVNEVMAEYFEQPYPARAAVGIAALPKGVQVEMDAIMVLGD